jgi:hypothetical protein
MDRFGIGGAGMKFKLLSVALVFVMLLGALPMISDDAAAEDPIAENILPSDDSDIWSSHANTNYGALNSLTVASGTSALVKFDLTNLEWTDIQLAKFYYKPVGFGYSGTYSLTLGFYELTQDWDESTVTYNNVPDNGTPAFASVVTVYGNYAFKNIDITNIIRNQCNGTNFGFIIKADVVNPLSAISFHSAESSSVSERPYLALIHTGVIGWAPTITSTPITSGAVGIQYNYDVNANTTATFSLASAPSFLNINSATGMIYGIPDASGTFSITVHAYSSIGLSNGSQTYSLIVSQGTSPFIFPASGKDGYIVDGTDVHAGTVMGILDYSFNDEHRTYISIDTSGVPDNVDIGTATLHFRMDAGLVAQISIYSCEYGATLTAAAWGATDLLGYHTLYDPNWVEMPISSDLINTTGETQFEVRTWNYDGDMIYLYNSEYAPYITLDYEWGGMTLNYLNTTGGVIFSATTMAERLDYNFTHDAYVIDLDTWQDGGFNITLPDQWTFHSATPYYTGANESTNNLLMTGVLGNHTYRIYFLCPRVILTTAWFSMFDSATGTGLTFESFVMKVSPGSVYDSNYSRTITQNFARLIYDWTYTVAVFDYFGNEITEQSFSTSDEEVFVQVAVDANSFKVFNQKDDFTKVRIYYANSTTPIEYYLAPWECVERSLRDGNYTVTVTFYANQTAGNTVYFNITVNGAEFLMIAGNTITRVITDVAGVRAVQEIITYMLTPDVVHIAEDLPMVPNDAFDSGIELVHPWSVVHGWANGTEFTNETLFYYSYYTARKYYEVTLNVTNSDGVDWTNVTWFIGFPENRTIDYSSVRVYDLNNACYLTPGLHYDMTLTGIRMKWTYFNDTLSRSLRISMYDANASAGNGLAMDNVDSYVPSQYEGVSYYLGEAKWTNSFTYAYSGQLQIRFTFKDADKMDASSIIVYDRNTQRRLGADEFTFGGGLLTIGNIDAAIGEVYGVDVYFKLDLSESSTISMTTEFLGMPLWLWFLSAGCVGIIALVVVDGRIVGKGRSSRKFRMNQTAGAFIVVLASIFFILWYFMEMGML